MPIPAPEIVEVTTTRVACDGGGARAGIRGSGCRSTRTRARSNAATATSKFVLKPGAARRTTEVAAFGKGSHLHLIDGSGFIFRAYHALPPLTRKSDGLPVGRGRGLLQHGLEDAARRPSGADAPTHVAVIFDKSEHTFRNELYPAYKAQRPPAPEDLVPQFRLIRDATRAFNLPCIEHGRLRGRRPHRHLRLPGARRRRAGDDRLLRQGPDAAGRARASTMLDTMKNRRSARTRWSRSSASGRSG